MNCSEVSGCPAQIQEEKTKASIKIDTTGMKVNSVLQFPGTNCKGTALLAAAKTSKRLSRALRQIYCSISFHQLKFVTT